MCRLALHCQYPCTCHIKACKHCQAAHCSILLHWAQGHAKPAAAAGQRERAADTAQAGHFLPAPLQLSHQGSICSEKDSFGPSTSHTEFPANMSGNSLYSHEVTCNQAAYTCMQAWVRSGLQELPQFLLTDSTNAVYWA